MDIRTIDILLQIEKRCALKVRENGIRTREGCVSSGRPRLFAIIAAIASWQSPLWSEMSTRRIHRRVTCCVWPC